MLAYRDFNPPARMLTLDFLFKVQFCRIICPPCVATRHALRKHKQAPMDLNSLQLRLIVRCHFITF